MSELVDFVNPELEVAPSLEPTPDGEPKEKKKRGKKADGGVKEPKEPKVKEPKVPKVKVAKEPKPRRDNVKAVSEMGSISSVRRFLQISIAKKAKSVGKDEAVARYEEEIEAAKLRLAGLLEEGLNSTDPILALIALDEEPNKILTHFIVIKEAEFDKWLEDNEYKVSRNVFKSIPIDIPQSFLDEMPEELYHAIKYRHNKTDYRLQAICKKFTFANLVLDGKLVNRGGKWVDPNAVVEKEPELVEVDEATE